MTKKELNRDIKRLGKGVYKAFAEGDDKYYEYIEKVAKPEFMRLYRADTQFEYMSLNSVKLMLRMNLKHRFVALHTFGLMINERDLLNI